MSAAHDGAEAVLREAAFGARPGTHPLPAATTAMSRWWRAVALGGQGRYAAAEAELAFLLGGPAGTGTPYDSLAASTRGSHLRQLGRHGVARPWDARGLVASSGAQATVDALLGLAADALGSGATKTAGRLLARCAAVLPEAGWRGQVRWHWVSAETALCEGARRLARTHAEQADGLARQSASVRHQLKSRLVLAAALGADGGAAASAALIEQSREQGLLPLRWGAMMLLNALEPGSAALEAELRTAAALLARRGGVLV